jgi:hypothetical protein
MVTAETALLIRDQLGSLCFTNLPAWKMRMYFCLTAPFKEYAALFYIASYPFMYQLGAGYPGLWRHVVH